MGKIVDYFLVFWEVKVTPCRGSFEKKRRGAPSEFRSHGCINERKICYSVMQII